MINKNSVKGLLSLVYCAFSLNLFSQSISGNIFSGIYKKNLGYANVNIYKKGKLVANVLTNEAGYFNVKLDTGVYECEVNYAGYEKITKEIKVTKDEKTDIGLKADEKSKYSTIEVESYSKKAASYAEKTISYSYSTGDADVLMLSGSSAPLSYSSGTYKSGYLSGSTYASKGMPAKNLWGEEGLKRDSARSGKLTAGEINDFSKWQLWTDLSAGELKTNQQYWNFTPVNRYTVQVKDQNGLPLANASAELLNGNKIIYMGKSDNTGKAELWSALDTLTKTSASSIKVAWNGNTKTINNIKKCENGINTFTFDNNKCEQPENVDIAIVVDATGSMQDEIDYLKFDLNNVVFKAKEFSSKLNLRFANVFYRDRSDVYLTQMQDFTGVLSESTAFSNRQKADGGGDFEEAVDAALDSAINKLSWRSETRTKILFLVLDAPPHNTPEIQQKMKNLCKKAAEKGIRIVPVAGSGSNKNTEYLMRCIALATNGTYTFLSDHSGVGNSHIKPSTDNYQVEVLNELLVRVIKSYTYMPDCKQTIANLGVNLPDSQVVVKNSIDTSKIDTLKSTTAKTILLDDSLNIQWKFYPNPTRGIIHIVSNKAIKELYITDLSGKALQVIGNINPEVVVTADLSEYATGIYLIRYPLGKQWVSGKIMLVRDY